MRVLRWVVMGCGLLVLLAANAFVSWALCFHSLLPTGGGGWWAFARCMAIGLIVEGLLLLPLLMAFAWGSRFRPRPSP